MKIPENDIAGSRRDYVGYGPNVPRVVWPGEARVAINFVINNEEGSEVHMAADGRNEAALGELSYVMDAKYRDLAMESVCEYGSRAGIWRLQRLFDKKNIPVTFFAAAVAL
jgi:allantoinase